MCSSSYCLDHQVENTTVSVQLKNNHPSASYRDRKIKRTKKITTSTCYNNINTDASINNIHVTDHHIHAA